jgi:hypothetical protein
MLNMYTQVKRDARVLMSGCGPETSYLAHLANVRGIPSMCFGACGKDTNDNGKTGLCCSSCSCTPFTIVLLNER